MPLDFVYPTRLDASVPSAAGEATAAYDGAEFERRPAHDYPVMRLPEARPVAAETLAVSLTSALEDHIRAASQARTSEPRRELPASPPVFEPSHEWRGHFQELRQATTGELSRTRHLLERRLDEMAQALHSDMRRLRDECRSEWEINSRDVFRSATALSHAQDRIHRLEAALTVMQREMQAAISLVRAVVPESAPGLPAPNAITPQGIPVSA